MDARRFNALVASLEQLARRDVEALRRRIRWLIAVGYAYVFGILVLVVALAVWLIAGAISSDGGGGSVRLAIFLGFLAFVILRSLWVRLELPQGDPITAADAPRLFARVEEIRTALRAPRPDVVLLNKEFNASVTQIPRFGVFGGHRTYLVLGLPLLYAMGPRQLDAILGHEFGHLSGSHPKFGLRVVRVGVVWAQLRGQLEASRSVFRHLFNWFFRWYVPRLEAHGHALARIDEFAADQDAVRATDATSIAQALSILAVHGPRYFEYLRSIHRRNEREPEAPPGTWSAVPELLRAREPDRTDAARLAEALRTENLVDDSHPALGHRLRALDRLPAADTPPSGLLQALVPPVATTSADHYLGDFATHQLERWERAWVAEIGEKWRKDHVELRALRAEVDGLRARDAAGAPLTPSECYTVAAALERLEGDEPAIPWLERCVAADPRHGPAHFMLGSIRLDRRDPAGEPLMRRAMELDPACILVANELIRRFHAARGDRAAILASDAEADAYLQRYEEVAAEFQEIKRSDRFEPAGLSAGEERKLTELAAGDGIKAIWVARKRTKAPSPRPFFVLLVEPTRKFMLGLGASGQHAVQSVLEGFASDSRQIFVVGWGESADWISRKIRSAGGSLVTAEGVHPLERWSWFRTHRRVLALLAGGLAIVAATIWAVI